MGSDGFRSLEVYRRSLELATQIHRAVQLWSRFDVSTVGIQIVRSADSVGANIAEAYGRRTYPDRLRILWLARGSLCELQHWIQTARERNLERPGDCKTRADELGRMLNGLARGWSRSPRD